MSKSDPYAPARSYPAKRPAPAPVENSEPEVEEATSPVPDGTIAEVKKWVGDDVDRANQALKKEQDDSEPRKTLVAYLEELVDDDR